MFIAAILGDPDCAVMRVLIVAFYFRRPEMEACSGRLFASSCRSTASRCTC
jgi:hypothetical protein